MDGLQRQRWPLRVAVAIVDVGRVVEWTLVGSLHEPRAVYPHLRGRRAQRMLRSRLVVEENPRHRYASSPGVRQKAIVAVEQQAHK